jgi:hypothetical protein
MADDPHNGKRHCPGHSGSRPRYHLLPPPPDEPRQIAPANDFTGDSSEEEKTGQSREVVYVNNLPHRVPTTTATSDLALAQDEAFAVGLARAGEAVRLAEHPAPLPDDALTPPAVAVMPDGDNAAPVAAVLSILRGSRRGLPFAPQHPASAMAVFVPARAMPVPLPEVTVDAQALTYFRRTGGLPPHNNTEIASLGAYLDAHQPATDAALAAIEEAYLMSHEPWPAQQLSMYRSAANTRKFCSQLGDQITLPGFQYRDVFLRYGIQPQSLRRVSLIRTVAIVIPDAATIAIQRAFVGVLMEMPFGYCRSIVGTYLSFLLDARWLCPYGLSADSHEYWARAVFVEPVVANQHTYLDTARVQGFDTIAAHLTALVDKSIRMGEMLAQLSRFFLSLLAEINNTPPRLALSTPVQRAVAKYLEWY